MHSLPCFTSDLCWRSIMLDGNGLVVRGLVEQPPHIQPVWTNASHPHYVPVPWIYYDVQSYMYMPLVEHYTQAGRIRNFPHLKIRCLYFSPVQLKSSHAGKQVLTRPPFPNFNGLHEAVCYPAEISALELSSTWSEDTPEQRLAVFHRSLSTDSNRFIEGQVIRWWSAQFTRDYLSYTSSPLYHAVTAGKGNRYTPLPEVFETWEKLSLEDMFALTYPRDTRYEVPKKLTPSCFDEHGQRQAQYTHKVRKGQQ